MTTMFARYFAGRKYWRGSGAGRKVMNEVETVRMFMYVGDGVIADDGYEAAVPARIRYGLVTVWEEISSKAESACLQELCKARNCVWN